MHQGQNAVTPVVVGDIVIYSGLDKGITAVRIRQAGSRWTADPVWTNEQLPMFMSSPFVSGKTLFGLSHRNRGQVFALDVATGKTLWTTKGRDGENASVMGSQAWLLISTTNGELRVATRDDREYKEVQRYQLTDGALWAHPAFSGRSIVVKDAEKIICWRF